VHLNPDQRITNNDEKVEGNLALKMAA